MESTCCICGVAFEARHSYGLCSIHFSRDVARELDRVEALSRHAKRNNIPCTITLLEWLSVLSDSAGVCMVCQEYSANVIEMFDPKQGYSYANVVPCCRACHIVRKEGLAKIEAGLSQYLAIPRPIPLFSDMTLGAE